MFADLKKRFTRSRTAPDDGTFVFTDYVPIRVRIIIVGLVVTAAMMGSGWICYQVANRAAAQSFYLYDTIYHTVNYARSAQRNLAQLNGHIVGLTLLREDQGDFSQAQERLEARTRAALDLATQDWFDTYRLDPANASNTSLALFLLAEAEANLRVEETSETGAMRPVLPAALARNRQTLLTHLTDLRPRLKALVSGTDMSDANGIISDLAALSEETELFAQSLSAEGYRRRLEAAELAGMTGTIILSAIIITILISVLAAFLFAEDMRRRLLRLSSFAQRVESGRLDCTNHIEGHTELTSLMRGLDRMQKSIRGKMNQIDGLRREADGLLETVLPPQIVKRLRKGEARIADARAEATIVFIDLTGFTKLTRQFGAAHLIDTLDDIFRRLDEAAERNNIEKIKTIGDAYMAAAGVTCETQTDDAIRCARFAIEAHAAIDEVAQRLGYPLSARTGLHNGSVVAGILGKSNLEFDVWGDAVNLAARLQSSAEPGEIRVSQAAYWRLQQEFETTALGEIDLKGMGPTHAYVLNAPKADRAKANIKP